MIYGCWACLLLRGISNTRSAVRSAGVAVTKLTIDVLMRVIAIIVIGVILRFPFIIVVVLGGSRRIAIFPIVCIFIAVLIVSIVDIVRFIVVDSRRISVVSESGVGKRSIPISLAFAFAFAFILTFVLALAATFGLALTITIITIPK